jgi:Mitochondrial ribosomal protein (VAR1)
MKYTKNSLFTNNQKNKAQLKENKIIKLKNFYSINNNPSNLKSTYFNKIFIDIIDKIKQKANYFNSNVKTKQNKDLIKVKKISDKLRKPLTLKGSEKNNIINNKHISNTKLIKIFLYGLKNLNNALVSNIKFNGLISIFFSGRKSEGYEIQPPIKVKREIKTQINLDLINHTQKKIELEKNKESNLIKIINLEKNQTMTISNLSKILALTLKKKEFNKNKAQEKYQDNLKNRINNSANLSIERKENILGNDSIDFVNGTDKRKSSIFLFISKLKQQEKKKNIESLEPKSSLVDNKEKKLKNNIRKYINSKISFNSKIVKLLSTSNNFNYYKYNQNNNILRNNVYEFLQRSFISMFSLISKPVFITTPDKVIIQLFFLIFKKEIIKKNNTKSILILENYNKLKSICNILTRFFKKPIELELVRLYLPYYNSNILVNLLGMFINKIKLRRIVKKFISKSVKNNSTNNSIINKSNQLIPSALSGIKIKVAGRLLTQRVIPRKTVKINSSGALSRNKTIFVETARFTNKNKRGAFSITINIGHKLRNS